MTWHAQAGQLVVTGEEAKLLREAVLRVGDEVVQASSDDDSVLGHAGVFDRMSRSQQLASLEAVARHLFHDTPDCLPLTAWSEATLATVLREAGQLVLEDLEAGGPNDFRQVLLDALSEEVDPTELADLTGWGWLLEVYEDRFLWDADFEEEGDLDLPPDQAFGTRAMLGITDDYYATPPPDLALNDNLARAALRIGVSTKSS